MQYVGHALCHQEGIVWIGDQRRKAVGHAEFFLDRSEYITPPSEVMAVGNAIAFLPIYGQYLRLVSLRCKFPELSH
jgi:hypothetical protein